MKAELAVEVLVELSVHKRRLRTNHGGNWWEIGVESEAMGILRMRIQFSCEVSNAE
jgi:hypothetical protein